ncbi:MAG: response regulator, partial [Pseudomonadales bacterium]|nr:response regulator [Pseudomonadales bacterium]
IKRITEFDFMGIIRRPGTQLPSILEQVVVDIAQPKDEDNVARLNGYVTQLICTEDKIDTRFLNITVRFVDDDPAKLAFLNEFMTNA